MENAPIDALTSVINALKDLDSDAQKRILQSVQTFFGLELTNSILEASTVKSRGDFEIPTATEGIFTENRQIAPKSFMRDKMPKTDVEKVACLAYYLTHYRDTPHFNTLDISTLNTEAAQPKFSNATYAVNNALQAGFLVPAVKGTKQLSASGELFVQMLPDHDAAKTATANMKSKRKTKKPQKK